MKDDLYRYIKGEGWVLRPPNPEITMRCGTVVRLEYRKPNPNEAYQFVTLGYDDDIDWVLNDEPTQMWIDIIKQGYYPSAARYSPHLEFSENDFCIVLVPV